MSFDIETARAAVEDVTEVEQPGRDIQRFVDLGDTSVTSQVIGEIKHEERLSAANGALVNGFVHELPGYEHNPNSGMNWFDLEDPYQVKMVRENAIWFRAHWPTFLVGEAPTDNPKYVDLLLADPSPDGLGWFKIVRAKTKSVAANQEMARTLATSAENADEYAAMRKTWAKGFVVNAAMSQTVDNGDIKRSFSSVMGGCPDFESIENGLTDEIMERFDVIRHLSHLAVAFGKLSELESLLDERAKLPNYPALLS